MHFICTVNGITLRETSMMVLKLKHCTEKDA